MKTVVLFAVLCAALAGPALAQDQHRRPDDIKQYLEQLQETAAAGYRLERENSFLPKQYFLEFVPK